MSKGQSVLKHIFLIIMLPLSLSGAQHAIAPLLSLDKDLTELKTTLAIAAINDFFAGKENGSKKEVFIANNRNRKNIITSLQHALERLRNDYSLPDLKNFTYEGSLQDDEDYDSSRHSLSELLNFNISKLQNILMQREETISDRLKGSRGLQDIKASLGIIQKKIDAPTLASETIRDLEKELKSLYDQLMVIFRGDLQLASAHFSTGFTKDEADESWIEPQEVELIENIFRDIDKYSNELKARAKQLAVKKPKPLTSQTTEELKEFIKKTTLEFMQKNNNDRTKAEKDLRDTFVALNSRINADTGITIDLTQLAIAEGYVKEIRDFLGRKYSLTTERELAQSENLVNERFNRFSVGFTGTTFLKRTARYLVEHATEIEKIIKTSNTTLSEYEAKDRELIEKAYKHFSSLIVQFEKATIYNENLNKTIQEENKTLPTLQAREESLALNAAHYKEIEVKLKTMIEKLQEASELPQAWFEGEKTLLQFLQSMERTYIISPHEMEQLVKITISISTLLEKLRSEQGVLKAIEELNSALRNIQSNDLFKKYTKNGVLNDDAPNVITTEEIVQMQTLIIRLAKAGQHLMQNYINKNLAGITSLLEEQYKNLLSKFNPALQKIILQLAQERAHYKKLGNVLDNLESARTSGALQRFEAMNKALKALKQEPITANLLDENSLKAIEDFAKTILTNRIASFFKEDEKTSKAAAAYSFIREASEEGAQAAYEIDGIDTSKATTFITLYKIFHEIEAIAIERAIAHWRALGEKIATEGCATKTVKDEISKLLQDLTIEYEEAMEAAEDPVVPATRKLIGESHKLRNTLNTTIIATLSAYKTCALQPSKSVEKIQFKLIEKVFGMDVTKSPYDEFRRKYFNLARERDPQRPGGSEDAFKELVNANESVKAYFGKS